MNQAQHAPNFCPNCGCNMLNVAAALQFAALRTNGPTHVNGNGDDRGKLALPAGTGKKRGRPPGSSARGRPWTPEDYDTLFRLRDEGKTPGELATLLNRTESGIRNQLYVAGRARAQKQKLEEAQRAAEAERAAQQPRKPPTNEELEKRIFELMDQGKNQRAIAKELTVPVKRIRRIQKEHHKNPTAIERS